MLPFLFLSRRGVFFPSLFLCSSSSCVVLELCLSSFLKILTKVPLNSYFDVRRQNGDINISTAYNAQSMVKSCHVLYIKIIRKLQISLSHHCFLQHPLKRMSRHPRNSQNMGWKNLQKLQNPPMFNAIFDKFSQMLGNISNNPLKHPF